MTRRLLLLLAGQLATGENRTRMVFSNITKLA